MLKQITLGIGVVSIMAACQPKCEPCPSAPNAPEKISLAATSKHIQNLFKSESAQIRGIELGSSVGQIQEDSAGFVAKSEQYAHYQPDLTEDYWADVLYYFDKENIINEINTDINTFSEYEADSVYYELIDYLDGKYGEGIMDPNFVRVWNIKNVKNGSYGVVTLDYKFPEEEFTELEGPDGNIEKVKNNPSILYNLKLVE